MKNILHAAATLGSRLLHLAGLRSRASRWNLALADQRLNLSEEDRPLIPVARAVSAPAWWTQPQSAESIAWHKERAVMKRIRRGTQANVSRYAAANFPAAELAAQP